MVPESADLALEQGHAGDGEGGVAALVALVAAGAGQGLLHRVAGDDAKRAGDAGLKLDLLDAAGRLGADEVVVVGLAADDDAEAGDTREAVFGELLGGKGQLVGAGDRDLGDRRGWHARQLEPLPRPAQQPLREVLVEAPHADAEVQGSEIPPLLLAELLQERSGFSHRRPWRRVPPRRGSSPRLAPGPDGAASDPSSRAWCAGRPRCGCWGPTRSAPARRPRGRSPRGRRSFSGCW